MLTFQEAIFALGKFWANEGCLIWEPYYLQVGAGTMNPATFLRVLGPEPWRVAYVEPSVRPDDARYGENPNRMGLHYQYQVILKPDPGDPQELYLRSLEALGIDPLKHDIRFVEDNWEQPALGAWGLGWEVWLDGLEITQFTYFQQAGGQTLDPVSVEMTYGLERILMAIQEVTHFGDILWDDRRTYGDVNLIGEQQHSRYYFETADVTLLRQMFDGYEAEATRSLEAGLTLPAYDQLLRCSHTFNVLDTRGAVGVTERSEFFGRMRRIARSVAESYLEEREHAGYPWLERDAQPDAQEAGGGEPGPDQPESFILEIGTEELPATDLTAALEQLEISIRSTLEEVRLEHGSVRVMGTPRRMIAFIEDLAPKQSGEERTVKGPPWEKAFDGNGEPTPAASGFASSSGVGVEHLQRQEIEGGTYAVAVVQEGGEPAQSALSAALPGLIAGLRFDKTMRWESTETAFSRPIRWIAAVHGSSVVPFEYAGLHTGRVSRGLRHSAQQAIDIQDAGSHLAALESEGITADVALRQAAIQAQIDDLSTKASGSVAFDSDLFREVTNLVEAPHALLGSYEDRYLDLPSEVLIAVMKKHQRYFPIESDGKLLPNFIVVSNGQRDSSDTIVHGNEQVIRARFEDARYFVARDLEHPLESYVERLEALTFQADLGSMLDKTHRLEGLTATLAAHLDLSENEGQAAVRAAQLCKADLATRMVVDMTSLQGSMGRYYALQSGESEAVAEAIYEHYLPRSAGDELPGSNPGIALGMADRLDSLIGLFSVGVRPTGTRDPFGLRRTAVGLIQILVERELGLDLSEALGWAWDGFERDGESDALEDCLAFITRRQQQLLRERGFPHDVVAAVLEEQGTDPVRAVRAVKKLVERIDQDDWALTLQAYSRCVRITRDVDGAYEFDDTKLVESSAQALFEALRAAEEAGRRPGSVTDFLAAFEPMIPAIDQFFDDVMVMTEDQTLRENRLALLQRVVQLGTGVADFSRLEGF